MDFRLQKDADVNSTHSEYAMYKSIIFGEKKFVGRTENKRN